MTDKKAVYVYAARKNDPIKEGAIDGLLDDLEAAERFVFPVDHGETMEELMEELNSWRDGLAVNL